MHECEREGIRKGRDGQANACLIYAKQEDPHELSLNRC